MAEQPSPASPRSTGALLGRGVSDSGRRRARGETISPAAEWLLDNFHLIGNEVRDGPSRPAAGLLSPATSLARGQHVEPAGGHGRRPDPAQRRPARCRAAPGLHPGVPVGVPTDDRRAVGLAERAQGRADREPAGLAEGIRRSRDDTSVPTPTSRSWTRARHHGSAAPSPTRRACPSSFGLLQRIREYGPHVAALRTDIDQWLALRQMTPEDAIRIEGQHQAADQVSMANTITSLRFGGTLDWSRFFESVSQVEHILRRDPSGTYGRMDFVSRDQYRRVVEELGGRPRGTRSGSRSTCVDAARRAEIVAATRDCARRLLPGRPRAPEFESSRLHASLRRARAPRAVRPRDGLVSRRHRAVDRARHRRRHRVCRRPRTRHGWHDRR